MAGHPAKWIGFGVFVLAMLAMDLGGSCGTPVWVAGWR